MSTYTSASQTPRTLIAHTSQAPISDLFSTIVDLADLSQSQNDQSKKYRQTKTTPTSTNDWSTRIGTHCWNASKARSELDERERSVSLDPSTLNIFRKKRAQEDLEYYESAACRAVGELLGARTGSYRPALVSLVMRFV